MSENYINNDWIDRYIRDELTAEEEIEFEEKLLEDLELQQELQAALAIKETLKRGDLIGGDVFEPSKTSTSRNTWTPFAMAASVALAVISSTLLWRSNIETAELRHQIDMLQQPRTSVLDVPVDIMRSSGNSTPDAIIQKPAGQAAIVLDIELSGRFKRQRDVHFELSEETDGEAVLTWNAMPTADNRARVVLNSESLPDGRVILSITAPDIESETRLLEFRPANR